jgi:hypothetical protein
MYGYVYSRNIYAMFNRRSIVPDIRLSKSNHVCLCLFKKVAIKQIHRHVDMSICIQLG